MTTAVTTDPSGKIKCELDGALVHSIFVHLKKTNPTWSDAEVKKALAAYQEKYPDAPLLSPSADAQIRARRMEEEKKGIAVIDGEERNMADVFGFPVEKTLNARKHPIKVIVADPSKMDPEDAAFIPKIDPNYVFNIELTKSVIIGLTLNMPMLFWGFHGSGKTTCFEQVCARLNRPFLRLQHTINTEEAHVLGQWAVKGGNTVFNPGPLPIAMQKGYVFCADEYDYAMPSVLSLYQPVLEGKALYIKDAPPEARVVHPHPNFRIFATGNTNGAGDDTGLYQGTQVQNSANYSRFKITERVEYPAPDIEAAIVAGQAGIRMDEAKKLVNFGTECRKAYAGGQMSLLPSPRELITAGVLGAVKAGDYREGLRKAFINRLSPTDRELADQYAQRVFGGH
jgi:cobaltochelatase CobS